jgi:hypothetical protein
VFVARLVDILNLYDRRDVVASVRYVHVDRICSKNLQCKEALTIHILGDTYALKSEKTMKLVDEQARQDEQGPTP